MNYSIVRIQTVPEVAIEKVYLENPGLEQVAYAEQIEKLLAENITFSGAFSREMRALGNEACEILSNCKPLQIKWADEHGLNVQSDSWQVQIILEQLKTLKPEVVYFQDILSVPESVRRQIKEEVPSIRLKVIQKGYPGETRPLDDADLLLVSSPILMERYKDLKPKLLYHSFDTNIWQQIGSPTTQNREHDLIFSGSTRMPEIRYWVLEDMLNRNMIEIWGNEDQFRHRKLGGRFNWKNQKKTIRAIEKWITGNKLDRKNMETRVSLYDETGKFKFTDKAEQLFARMMYGTISKKTLKERYPDQVHGPVFGRDYYRLMANSKVVFNIHASSAAMTVDNMKLFEATGVGACLLSDTGTNMSDLFDADYEIVTYTSIEEMESKAKFLLENDVERETIARAGQKKTLKQHSIVGRCVATDGFIRDCL